MTLKTSSITATSALLLSLTLVGCSEDSKATPEVDAAVDDNVEPVMGMDDAESTDADTEPKDTDTATYDAVADAGTTTADAATTADAGSDAGMSVGKDGYLLVADLAAGSEAIHAYSLPDLRHTGQIDGVKLGNHLGAIALADDRIVTSDDKNQQLIAIRIDENGKPTIAQRVDAELGTGGVWCCGDAELKYLAVASGREGNGSQVANILKLDDFTLTAFEVPMNVINNATEELHPAIAGNPLHLFAGVGAEVRAYPLDHVVAGHSPAPVASIAIHPGSHGPVVSHSRDVLYIAAAAGTGFDGVNTKSPFARAELIPWDVDGRTTGRNSRPRLSADGRYIYGAIARSEPTGAELWATREVDLSIVDLETRTPKRTLLTTGIVPKFQISKKYALFANVTASADYAILVDVDPASRTFQQTFAKIELPRLTNGPVAGQAITGKEARASAITPDGKWAFVSHGGDGKISVIDTEKKAIVSTVETSSKLLGGGYMFAFQPGATPTDTCTR